MDNINKAIFFWTEFIKVGTNLVRDRKTEVLLNKLFQLSLSPDPTLHYTAPDLDVVPDRGVGVLGGEHGPAGEGLHHGGALLMQGEPDLARHQRGLVRDVEHGVVHLNT